MRLIVCFLLASIPLSASSINFDVWCSTAPTTQGPDSAFCGDSLDAASASVNGFSVATSASAAAGGYPSSSAMVTFTEQLVFTFFGGTGEGFAQPWLALSIFDETGSSGVATAWLGGCIVNNGSEKCPWDSVSFQFGVPETLTLTLYAGADAFGELYVPASASGEAAYDGFLGFYDFYGNPLSGVTYQVVPVGPSTPEPSTLLLTLAGAALLACALRRRPAVRDLIGKARRGAATESR